MSDDLNNPLLNDDASLGSGGAGAEDIVGALTEGGGDGPVIADEKKPLNRSTVVTFVVLVIGAAGVWFMYQRTGPGKAAANTKETVEASKTINNFLSGGDENIRLMETMLRNTQKVVQDFLNYPSMTQIPLSDLRTNPFRLKPDVRGDNGALSEAQEKRKREEERLAALKAVQGLQLQSIMYGDSRRACMINGALYTETQQVNGFTIEKINQASVVVKNGPYRFDLRMQR